MGRPQTASTGDRETGPSVEHDKGSLSFSFEKAYQRFMTMSPLSFACPALEQSYLDHQATMAASYMEFHARYMLCSIGMMFARARDGSLAAFSTLWAHLITAASIAELALMACFTLWPKLLKSRWQEWMLALRLWAMVRARHTAAHMLFKDPHSSFLSTFNRCSHVVLLIGLPLRFPLRLGPNAASLFVVLLATWWGALGGCPTSVIKPEFESWLAQTKWLKPLFQPHVQVAGGRNGLTCGWPVSGTWERFLLTCQLAACVGAVLISAFLEVQDRRAFLVKHWMLLDRMGKKGLRSGPSEVLTGFEPALPLSWGSSSPFSYCMTL
eukprot:jgi/Botrbrau1/12528/Bobra.0169s0070.1